MRNLSLKYGPRVAALGSAFVAGSALAAPPESFTTAVTTVTADGVAMAGALVGIAAAVLVVMIAMKFVKRIKGAV